MLPRPLRPTLFPYTTLFRSLAGGEPADLGALRRCSPRHVSSRGSAPSPEAPDVVVQHQELQGMEDRKSTRLNSSHEWISYAVFCLKKKRTKRISKGFRYPHL